MSRDLAYLRSLSASLERNRSRKLAEAAFIAKRDLWDERGDEFDRLICEANTLAEKIGHVQRSYDGLVSRIMERMRLEIQSRHNRPHKPTTYQPVTYQAPEAIPFRRAFSALPCRGQNRADNDRPSEVMNCSLQGAPPPWNYSWGYAFKPFSEMEPTDTGGGFQFRRRM